MTHVAKQSPMGDRKVQGEICVQDKPKPMSTEISQIYTPKHECDIYVVYVYSSRYVCTLEK